MMSFIFAAWRSSYINPRLNSLLGSAVSAGDVNKVMRALDAGADPNTCMPWDFGLSYFGGQRQRVPVLTVAAIEGYEDIVVQLLDCKADTEARGDHHETPLICATMRGHTAIVEKLLDYGADVASVNTRDGTQAIHWAFLYTNFRRTLEVAQLLHRHGADLGATDNIGNTPIHGTIVFSLGCKAAVEWLIEQGVDVTATNNYGRTAADNADMHGQKEWAEWLRSCERKQQKHKEDEKIKTRKRDRKVVILNYIKFPPPLTKREGAEKDSTNLGDKFTSFGYDVTIHENLTASATKNVLNRLQADTSMKCLILVILSHGQSKYCFYTGEGSIMDLDVIRKKFTDSACPQLKGLAKIILSNFCRGEDLELRRDATAQVEVPHNVVTVHACVDNVQALRHPRNGTVFISSFCEVVKQDHELQDTLNKLYEKMKEKRGTTPMAETFFPFPKFTF